MNRKGFYHSKEKVGYPFLENVNFILESTLRNIIMLALLFLVLAPVSMASANPGPPFLNPLRARGFTLIPSPQQVELSTENVVIDETWSVDMKGAVKNMALTRMIRGSEDLHKLTFSKTGNKKIILTVKPGTVQGINDPELSKQGYLLKITSGSVEITGNDQAGLFYGVQSFLQLLRRNPAGQLVLPEGEIRDWPDLQLRFVHWDTKHHQKRISTLKRLIDWHAFFKVNMISFEMEDKYEYPRHPVIGAPGAYTKAEMQELTAYALERHIQLVPNIQAPAHMAFVLKHEEFAHLRSDGSNYQACMCDQEAMDLILDMYQDMIDATPGVDYFHVSTDEIYYAGICDKCNAPYNEQNRSLAWAEFANKVHDWLAERGRRMIAWVEYPLLAEDISLLPPGIINGIGGNKDFIQEERKIGMRQLAYSSTQGAEYLFPNHFATHYRGRNIEGRLTDIYKTVRKNIAAGGDLIGTFAAAWDDSGLHEETFHLGWATVTQYGWTYDSPSLEQSVADFFDVFYGPGSPDMRPVYQDLMDGARFFESGWEKVKSTERPTGYGNSRGKGFGGGRTDELLVLPEVPASNMLNTTARFTERYSSLIEAAEQREEQSLNLLYRLSSYSAKVERNHYNVEVLLSIANLEHHFIRTVLTLRDVEEHLLKAESEAAAGNPSNAVANLTEASIKVADLIESADEIWQNITMTWEKSRFEKGRSLDGRNFVHVMDDVKDHWADRRAGLDYMIAPFQRMNLPDFHHRLNDRINMYAAAHNIMVRGIKEARLED